MKDDLLKTVFLEVLKSEYVQHTNCQLNIGSVTERERKRGIVTMISQNSC